MAQSNDYVMERKPKEKKPETPSKINVSNWRQFKAILRKDIVMEMRTKEMITSMGLYALLVLVIYYIALSQAGQGFDFTRIAAGLLFLAIIFTSLLGLNRSLVHEQDQGCLEALLLAPIDRPIIFLGKAVGNFIFLCIVEVFIVPIFYFLFLGGGALAQSGPWWMLVVAIVVGSIGIAGAGTLMATMSVNTRGKDFILAVMFVPVMFPLLLIIVTAMTSVIVANPGYVASFWQQIAGAVVFDVIMVGVGYVLYDFVLGA